ncbi:MAG TPA: 3-isopropylmalate dehydratase small subunit [Caulobacteraceae bacterium]|nr:3-isopropylmalate dehydratase small subunit [Caulobacteraceae bacterium]
MRKFDHLQGVAAPLPAANIDTDQIIPKQFLKTVEREGLGKGLFYDFRFDLEGHEKPDFVLNQPAYKGARILIAGDNFGCGSSREHAPWALDDFGLRCVVSTSFADIFYNNCFQNGLLPAIVSSEDLHALMGEAKGGNHVFAVDLDAQTISAPSGKTVRFAIDAGRKEKLLKGLDAIGETLEHAPEIDRFEQKRRQTQPWAAA